VSAQTGNTAAQSVAVGIGSIAGLVNAFTQTIVKALGSMFLALGVVAFFYGVVEYVWGLRKGDSTKVANGNKFMGWGLLSLFVMFSVYGIIKFGQNLIFQGTIDPNKIEIPDFIFNKSATTGGGGPVTPLPGTGNDRSGSGAAIGTGNTGLRVLNPLIGGSNSGGSSGGSNYDSRTTSVPDIPCNQMHGGSCRSGGISGTCSDWMCNTSASEGPVDAATYQCPDGSMVLPSDARLCQNVTTTDPVSTVDTSPGDGGSVLCSSLDEATCGMYGNCQWVNSEEIGTFCNSVK
jgi:hypothetical protein